MEREHSRHTRLFELHGLSALRKFLASMPSDQSTWLLSAPQDGYAEGLLQELSSKLQKQTSFSRENIAEFTIPTFKVRSYFSSGAFNALMYDS